MSSYNVIAFYLRGFLQNVLKPSLETEIWT